ncbi:MAG: OmpA family protein [Maricaulaceae bacterium]
MKRTLLLLSAIALTLTACTTDPFTGERQISRTARGAGVGAVGGAATGALLGQVFGGRPGKGAWIGAAAGTALGTGVGVYQDRQEARLRQELAGQGVNVTRDGDTIVLNMRDAITFPTNQATLNASAVNTLAGVTTVLKEFDQTFVEIGGHTDSVGSEDANQQLSERRAASVYDYLVGQGVAGGRLRAVGYGEGFPIADNTTDFGRAQNRRVEIYIVPNA